MHGDDRCAPHSSSPCTIEPPLLLPRRVVEKQQQWIIQCLPTSGCTCGYIIDRRKVAARSPPRAISLPRVISPPRPAPSSGLCAHAVILPVRHVHCRLHDVAPSSSPFARIVHLETPPPPRRPRRSPRRSLVPRTRAVVLGYRAATSTPPESCTRAVVFVYVDRLTSPDLHRSLFMMLHNHSS